MSENYHVGRIIAAIVAFVIFIWAIIILVGALDSINKTGPTTVAVIRNGGPFQAKTIREVRGPAEGTKISGLFSQVRDYIAGNETRYYTVSSDPSLGDTSGSDFIKVPTRDGVNVALDAQITFYTNFTNKSGEITPCNEETDCSGFKYLVEKFDTSYGNRQFASKTGGEHHVWEGNTGWNAFLDSIFRPVVENAFREQIGSVDCADLVSSCALVQSSVEGAEANAKFTPQDNRTHFQEIQDNVQNEIESDIKKALGSEYLVGFHVQLTKVELPKEVQGAIDAAQSNFAQIAEARAQKEQAQYKAEANEIISKSLLSNPNLTYLKAVEALKNSTATIILGEPGMGLNIGGK
jgi:hypothetical protein